MRASLSLCSALLAVAATAGCRDSTPVAPDGPSPDPEASAAASPRSTLRTYDDELSALGERSPGFGGLFYDDAGELNVYLTDPSRRAEAAGPVAAFLAGHGRPDASREVAAMKVLPARYTFGQLHRWYNTMRRKLPRAGITQTDINERENRIVVGVLDEAAAASVTESLRGLGLPAEAVAVRVTAPTEMSGLQDKHRPVAGALQIQTSTGICTLSFNAHPLSGSTVVYTDAYFVTNSHCTDSFGSVTGVGAGQPDLNNPIGYEIVDPALFTDAQDARCRPGRLCRYTDAALFRYNAGVTYDFAKIAFNVVNQLGKYTITDANVGGYSIRLGKLYKVGRTTGTTTGYWAGSCVDVVQYRRGADTGRDMLCQYQVDLSSGEGDSGSPVFYYLGDLKADLQGVFWGTAYNGQGTAVYGTFSSYSLVADEIANASGIRISVCADGTKCDG